jgi:ribosomal RNA-processing protein 36
MSDYSSDSESIPSQSEFSNNSEPQQQNEEELLQNELEEIEFGKLIQAQKKLEIQEKINNKKEKSKKVIEDLEKTNKEKAKSEPKEFSALVKPKKAFKNIKKELRRDPRFDDLSGNINMDYFKANYSFVNEKANDYLGKIKNLKSKGKRMEDKDYELIKKQVNFVKGWVKQNQYSELKNDIKKDLIKENQNRAEFGKNPIYLKKDQMKKVLKITKMEQRDEDEQKRFLKRKKNKETRKLKSEKNDLLPNKR